MHTFHTVKNMIFLNILLRVSMFKTVKLKILIHRKHKSGFQVILRNSMYSMHTIVPVYNRFRPLHNV
jgi:hypothetical protein